MKLFPAIDIYRGQCVRLYKGDFRRVTVYGDPVEMALKWQSQGAEYLHVVDLNGAENGSDENLDVIGRLIRAVSIPVQLGGGIRTVEIAKARLDSGAARVILGTVCCAHPEAVSEFISAFGGGRLVCGIDCRDGLAAVSGWKDVSLRTGREVGQQMKRLGIGTAVFTDISRDGALTGVNVQACAEFGRQTGLEVIASGGVKSLADLRALRQNGVYGAILGKAIYENIFDVRQAMEEL